MKRKPNISFDKYCVYLNVCLIRLLCAHNFIFKKIARKQKHALRQHKTFRMKKISLRLLFVSAGDTRYNP